MRQIAMILCISLFVAGTSPSHAESLIIDADKQFQFAELLFNKGDYPRAITEYNRFIHFFPYDDRTGTALFQTAMAHRLNNQFNDAIEGFQAVIKRSPKDTLAVRSHFLIAACYVKLNDPLSARQILMILLNNHEDSDVRDAAKYRIAWIDIETGHFKQAMDRIQQISQTDVPWLPVQELSADLAEAAALPGKNPALAGVLSVVPGAGYFYCGRYQDGLMAFLLNGALIWAAVESFSEGNEALGCVISVVESGFYIGNIYGGINAAHKYNTRQKQTVIDRLKSGYRIGMSPSSDKTGWQFNLQHDF
ncbi:MAG: tetratricopeptide repeat protein [Desulfatirhabdiaceae bacterium]